MHSRPARTPGGEAQQGREEGWRWGRTLTLRAPRASSQVAFGATFSSCPESGQGRRRGTGGQHTQTFPSWWRWARRGSPSQDRPRCAAHPPASSPRLAPLTPHHGAVPEVSGQLRVLTGENGASHAEHDTQHREQGEEGDLWRQGADQGRGLWSAPLHGGRHPPPHTRASGWREPESQVPSLGHKRAPPQVLGTCLPAGTRPWHLPLE